MSAVIRHLALCALACLTDAAQVLGAPSLDSTFGQDGRVAVELGQSNSANAIVVQADGKILLAGSVSPGQAKNFSLLRFNADGSLDTGFNREGALITSISLGDDEALALGILADGRIVAGGYSSNGENRDFALACYFPDGSLDKDFGRNGVVLTPVSGGDDEISALAITADDKIVVAGNVAGTTGSVAVAARYFADGELDSSFGERGVSLIGVGNEARVEGIALREHGGVVLSGTFRSGQRVSLMLAGLDDHGLLDSSFGRNGIAVPAGTMLFSEGYRLAADAEGMLYVAGAAGEPGRRDTALFRFFSDGEPDPDFGRAGVVINPVSPEDDLLYDVAVNERGVIASGFSTDGGQRRFLLASYATANGSMDAPGLRLPVVQLQDAKKYPVLSTEAKRRVKSRQPRKSDAAYLPLSWQAAPFAQPYRTTVSTTVPALRRLDGRGISETQVFQSSPLWQGAVQTLLGFLLPAAAAAEIPPKSAESAEPGNASASEQTTVPEAAPKVSVFSFGEGEGVGYAATMDAAGNVLVAGSVQRGQGSSMAVARFEAASVYDTDAFINQAGSSHLAVRTLPPARVTRSSAACGGEILPELGVAVWQRGLVFSTAANPVLLSRNLPEEEDEEDGAGPVSSSNLASGPGQLVRTVLDTAAASAHSGQLSGSPTDYSQPADAAGPALPIVRENAERGALASGAGYGSFTARLEHLRPGTRYYVRAYAITGEGAVYYGPQHGFTTADACFIATAAYGSIGHPAVTILRQFRDTMLMTNAFGQALIDIYYRISPPLAQGISEHALLRWLVGLALLPVVGLSWLVLHVGPVPVLVSLMLAAMLGWGLRSRLWHGPVWRRFPDSQQGFTLIELMVVMVILGILAALITPRIMDRPEEARRTKAEVQIRSIEQALKLYRLDNGQYPSTEQGLQALVAPPALGKPARKWRQGGYLERGRVPKDPWGSDYVYLSPGLHDEFDLISYGADNQAGGEGKDADVNNWDLQ